MSPRRSLCHPVVSAALTLHCTSSAAPDADPGSTATTEPLEASSNASAPTTAGDPPDTTGSTSEATAPASSSSGSSEGGGLSGLCGDGFLDEGEACDQGTANRDDGACTLDCEAAACGDGLVWVGVEACDDAADNGNHYGGCSPACTRNPWCGDAVLDIQFEDCDFGENNGTGEPNGDQGPCSGGCRWDGRIVFASSLLYNGDLRDGELEGLDGADAQCRLRAWAAGFQRWKTFRAWLSDGDTGPLERFVAIPVRPLLLPNGELVAHSLSELVVLGPGEGIRVDEFGVPLPPSLVWTSTGVTGDPASPDDPCEDWTSAAAGPSARVGLSHMPKEPMDEWEQWSAQKQWTSKLSWECSELARLYCFEQ